MQAWQDENSAAALHRKGRPGGAQGLAGAWAGQGALPGKLLPGASARKALGNITNQQGVRPYGAALGPHKALGSAMPAQQGPAEPQAECSQAALAHSAAAPELDVDCSPEKRAGMGWQELERAREAHTDAEISARLAAIADAPSCNPVFWPVRAASGPALRPRPAQHAALRMPRARVRTGRRPGAQACWELRSRGRARQRDPLHLQRSRQVHGAGRPGCAAATL